jgi:hypothetical protein
LFFDDCDVGASQEVFNRTYHGEKRQLVGHVKVFEDKKREKMQS